MNKGMSQTLTLVVIASVLMMTALTVAVLGRSTLTGQNEQLRNDRCFQAVKGSCEISAGDEITKPSACSDVSDTEIENIGNVKQSDGSTITCEE